MEAREAFLHAGGKEFHFIRCPNDRPEWIRALSERSLRHMQGWPTSGGDDAEESAASRRRALDMGAKQ